MAIDTNTCGGSISPIDSNMNKLNRVRELTSEIISQVGIKKIGFALNEIFDPSTSLDLRQVTCTLIVNSKRTFSFSLKVADDDAGYLQSRARAVEALDLAIPSSVTETPGDRLKHLDLARTEDFAGVLDDGGAYSAEKISNLVLEHIRNISINCAKSAVSKAGNAIGKRAAIAVRQKKDNPFPEIFFAFLGDDGSKEKTIPTLTIKQILTNTTEDVAKILIHSLSTAIPDTCLNSWC